MRVELMPYEQKVVKLSKQRTIKRLKENLIENQKIYDNWSTETNPRRLAYEKQLKDVEQGFINE